MNLWVDAGVLHNGNYGGQQEAWIAVHDGIDVLVEEYIGDRTNNEGEMLAVAAAIAILKLTPGSIPATIFSDSQIAVNLINRKWNAKKPHLKALLATINLPKDVQLEWIPRENNYAGHFLEEAYCV